MTLDLVEKFYRTLKTQEKEGWSLQTRLRQEGIVGAKKRWLNRKMFIWRAQRVMPPLEVMNILFKGFYFTTEERETYLRLAMAQEKEGR